MRRYGWNKHTLEPYEDERSEKSQFSLAVKIPSNPHQQVIYSIIHLVIALSNRNSTFPIRHFKKITSILFKCATCCYTLWMGH